MGSLADREMITPLQVPSPCGQNNRALVAGELLGMPAGAITAQDYCLISEIVPMSDSGILKWPTSAVCSGPPVGQSELLVCTERELRTGAGVGLESQSGTIRADSPGV